MPAKLPIFRAFVGCAALFPLLTVTAAPEYRMTRLGPSKPISLTTGINNRGVLVGYVGAMKGTIAHGARFVRTRAQTIKPKGGRISYPVAINNPGLAVGTILNRAAVFYGSRPVKLYDQLTPGSGWTSLVEAKDINDHGQIVGNGYLSGKGYRGFVYQNGVATALTGLDPFLPATAAAINESGAVAGTASVPPGSFGHAALFLPGETRDLGSLGKQSWATNLNNQNVVVGASRLGNGNTHSFVYRNGVMTDLGALPGYRRIVATAINEDNEIVGTAGNGRKRLDHAFLHRRGRLYDLNELVTNRGRYTIVQATDINDKGAISAVAYDEVTQRRHAVRLDVVK